MEDRKILCLFSQITAAQINNVVFTAIRPGRFKLRKTEILLKPSDVTNNNAFDVCFGIWIVKQGEPNPACNWEFDAGGVFKACWSGNCQGCVWWGCHGWMDRSQEPPIDAGDSIVGGPTVQKLSSYGETQKRWDMAVGDRCILAYQCSSNVYDLGNIVATIDYDYGN